ncbi:MAG: tripartite tricarboxylate transporter substrate-binding protein, partial [Rhodospirillales bacterium]
MDEWKRREVLRTMGLATMASAIPLTEVFAAKWPSRPITMIIATKAGGGVDGVARTVAPMLESRIKNATLNVVNKTGATGSIGGKYVFGKPADGHGMFCAGGFNRGLRALGLWDLTGTKDWQYFGADTSIASISVPIDSPIKSMEDLVKQAKDNPGKLRMSTNGLG